MTTPEVLVTRPRRRTLLVVLALVVLLLTGLLVRFVLRPDPPTGPVLTGDVSVVVTDVSFDQRDTDYTVTGVEAVTRGDEGLVRLHLAWSENAYDSADTRPLPLFGAEVLHHEPYAGLTAACGLSALQTIPADTRLMTVDLPCSGLLVPEDVVSVTLRD